MTTLNIQLPRQLKQFAEAQAAAEGVEVSEFMTILLSKEQRRRAAIHDLEAKLEAGMTSGKSIVVDDNYWVAKRAKLLGAAQAKKRKSA